MKDKFCCGGNGFSFFEVWEGLLKGGKFSILKRCFFKAGKRRVKIDFRLLLYIVIIYIFLFMFIDLDVMLF